MCSVFSVEKYSKMANRAVIDWYGEQICSFFGFIITTTLFTILYRKISKSNSETHGNKFPIIMQFQIFIIYIVTIVYCLLPAVIFVGMSLLQPSIQPLFCKIIPAVAVSAFGIVQIGVINFFITRLQLSFENSKFALSTFGIYLFRIIVSVSFIILMIFIFIFIGSAPYNIYKQDIDYSGNATACSAMRHISFEFMIVAGLVANTVCFGNIIVSVLFTNRLYKLIKEIHNINKKSISNITENETNDKLIFIALMKKQSLIVGVLVQCTILSYIVTMLSNSAIYSRINLIVIIVMIFLSFRFNEYYFKLFKCDKLTTLCCNCFEHYIMKQIGGNPSMTNTEKNLEKQIEIHSNTKTETIDSNNQPQKV
eukprot:188246_1